MWDCSHQARKLIDRDQVWKLIIEAFKILKYQDPSDKYRRSFEQIFYHTRSCILFTLTLTELGLRLGRMSPIVSYRRPMSPIVAQCCSSSPNFTHCRLILPNVLQQCVVIILYFGSNTVYSMVWDLRSSSKRNTLLCKTQRNYLMSRPFLFLQVSLNYYKNIGKSHIDFSTFCHHGRLAGVLVHKINIMGEGFSGSSNHG